MGTPPLYTLGNFTIDDIVHYDGTTSMGQPGGNVLYSALGAQTWLPQVGVLARLGNDLPAQYLDALLKSGLTLAVMQVEEPNIHDWVLYEPDGLHQFLNHLRSGDNDTMSLRAGEVPEVHRHAQAYHIAPMPLERQKELVGALKRSDNLVSVDPHERWISGDEGRLFDLLGQVDFVLPSLEQAIALFGDGSPERAVREFARHVRRAAVLKLGDKGSLVFDNSTGMLTHVPVCSVQVVDVTGAGDAFCGGFLAGVLKTQNAVEAACYGTVAASFCVEGSGVFASAKRDRKQAELRLAILKREVKLGKRL